MVTAKKYSTYKQFPALNPSYLDHMAPLQLEKNCNVPFFCPSVGAANVHMPGYSTYNFLALSTGQQNVAGVPSELLSPQYNISCPTENPYLAASHFVLPHGLGLHVKPIDASPAREKKFLIFDRSGDQMRLFFSPLLSPPNKTSSTKAPASANFPCQENAAGVDQQLLMKSLTGDENWDENHLTDEEGEMDEDSEEINALLYSDSDDEYDNNDYDSDKDEVTSTGHSSFIIEEDYNKEKSFELEREGASSDVFVKRQRLLYGKYKNPSLGSTGSPMKHAVSGNYKDDVASGTAGYNNSHDDIDPSKREKVVKIRQALKILKSILPGLTSKDPLSIIDKAIIYLKSMKTEATSLGVGHPGFKSAAFA